jgi:hypothetical protein
VSAPANGLRGEVALVLGGHELVLRPTFAALVAAETEAGSLGTLLQRASEGDVRLGDVAALLWACGRAAWPSGGRDSFEEALAEAGLAAALPAYRALLSQAFLGR